MMQGVGKLYIFTSCAHFRRHSSRCSRTTHWSYAKTTVSNLCAYTTAAPVQRPSRIKNILIASTILLAAGLGYNYITNTRASVHRWLAVPLIRAVWPDAEDAHESGVRLLKELHRFGLHPRERGRLDDAKDLETEVFGYTLVNPLGISSGLDKHGEIPTQLLALG
jgi:dihydroorotate dehydrogenase